MNKNQIVTHDFSNPDSRQKYESSWADEPKMRDIYENCWQCGGCAFYAPFNSDWGLCCHDKSRHHMETVFEHFSCPSIVNQGWEEHSFIDFDEYPRAKQILKLRFELPETLYRLAKKLAEQQGEDVDMFISFKLFKLLEKMIEDETPDEPAES